MAERCKIQPFSIVIAGSQDAVRDGIAQTMARLASLDLPQDKAGSVELVLAEALNNTVEHALATVTPQSRIEIRGSYNAACLRLTIIDQGKPMPHEALPTGHAPELDVEFENLPEGGFGWHMIHALARDVEYVRVSEANHLSLHFDITS
ncbi:ATP-binding protein [Sulfitobacter sp.]|uniref:ATP-binding protein n=1 Tax=Sulfitobacter sp. TaxID=1903071 RepID=UPI0030018C19